MVSIKHFILSGVDCMLSYEDGDWIYVNHSDARGIGLSAQHISVDIYRIDYIEQTAHRIRFDIVNRLWKDVSLFTCIGWWLKSLHK